MPHDVVLASSNNAQVNNQKPVISYDIMACAHERVSVSENKL